MADWESYASYETERNRRNNDLTRVTLKHLCADSEFVFNLFTYFIVRELTPICMRLRHFVKDIYYLFKFKDIFKDIDVATIPIQISAYSLTLEKVNNSE